MASLIVKKLNQGIAALSNVINIALSTQCVLCHAASLHHFCPPCFAELPKVPPSCKQCGRFLSDVAQKICGKCIYETPCYDSVYSLFPYETPIIQLILRLKFRQQLYYAKTFADLLQKKIQQEWYLTNSLPDLIIPVPLHPLRLRERGYNQALEIVKVLSKQLKIPIDRYGLVRIKHTKPQTALPKTKRKENVSGAFSANRSYMGLHLAIIDDVMTTGQTLSECCKLLKAQGAKAIDIWCCARRGSY